MSIKGKYEIGRNKARLNKLTVKAYGLRWSKAKGKTKRVSVIQDIREDELNARPQKAVQQSQQGQK